MYDLTIIRQGGGVYIDSREVAEVIGKNHKDLLRDIRGYITIIGNSNERNLAPINFFVESSYTDSRGRAKPCYLLSKLGCELCANKLIGEKGVLFTAAYVTKFNQLEAAERAELETRLKMPKPRLGEINACARIVVRGMKSLGTTPERIMCFIKEAYKPFGISVDFDAEDEITPRWYRAIEIAKLSGLYSLFGRPHAQAAACLLNEIIFIGAEHKRVEAENYGDYAGIRVLYDDYALAAVMQWLVDNHCPDEIYGFERTYHVQYHIE